MYDECELTKLCYTLKYCLQQEMRVTLQFTGVPCMKSYKVIVSTKYREWRRSSGRI